MEIVKFLCEVTTLVDDHPKNGTTPLHLAVEHGHFEMVKHLVTKGAKVNAVRHQDQFTPLHVAIKNNHEDIVTYLIENGAKVNEVLDKDVHNPLMLAIVESHDTIVEILFKNGAYMDHDDMQYLDNAIFKYVKVNVMNTKALAIVKCLLQRMRDINKILDFWPKNTILHRAIQYGNQNIIKILVDHGSDINAKDADSNTPLHLALTSKRTKIAKQLIEFGALLDCKNINDETPLHICSEKGLNEIAKILIKHNVDLNPLSKPSIIGRKIQYGDF